MPTWSDPKTWTVGEVLTSPDMNTYLRDNTDYLFTPPMCQAYANVPQSINHAVLVACELNAERFDPYNAHSTIVNNTRIYAQQTGVYHVSGSFFFEVGASGSRLIGLFANGSQAIARHMNPVPSGNHAYLSISSPWKFTQDDYVELYAYQDSGGSVNVQEAHLSLVWAGAGE